MRHMLPTQAFEHLSANPDALFVDCRTDAEFYFVGHPIGALLVPWCEIPDWSRNPHFVADVRQLAGSSTERPVVLICRSGQRSVDAGLALEAAGFADVVNVLHGFEGDLDGQRRRGLRNGWRFDGLPWEQI